MTYSDCYKRVLPLGTLIRTALVVTHTKFWLLQEGLAGWHFGGRYGRLDFNCTMSSTALGKSEKKIQKNPKQIRYKCTHNWPNLTCENMKGKTYKKLTNQILGSHIKILEKINLFEEGVCFVEYPIRQIFLRQSSSDTLFSTLISIWYLYLCSCFTLHAVSRPFQIPCNIKWSAKNAREKNWFTTECASEPSTPCTICEVLEKFLVMLKKCF